MTSEQVRELREWVSLAMMVGALVVLVDVSHGGPVRRFLRTFADEMAAPAPETDDEPTGSGVIGEAYRILRETPEGG